MRITSKKAFITRMFYFIVFVFVVIFLILLIKNSWNVEAAVNGFLDLLRLSKSG